MITVLLNGCMGRMGKVITEMANERDDIKIIAGIDRNGGEAPFPVYSSLSDVAETPDVIIDFSNPEALDDLLAFANKNNTPVIICTTGFSNEQIDKIKKSSEKLPVFFSANMSLGVNLLGELAKKAAKVLYPNFNIEIIEKHHNQKIDAPSGTAIMLADEISSVIDDNIDYEYNRHDKREKRPINEIGIHSVRAGTIAGEHEVLFGGPDEIISIKHTASSRNIFAAGSLNAALYMAEKEPGLYSMKDMID